MSSTWWLTIIIVGTLGGLLSERLRRSHPRWTIKLSEHILYYLMIAIAFGVWQKSVAAGIFAFLLLEFLVEGRTREP